MPDDKVNRVLRLCVGGALDSATDENLGAALRAAVTSGHAAVHVDVSAVTFLASSTVDELERTARTAAEYGCEFRLVNPGELTAIILDVTGAWPTLCGPDARPPQPRRRRAGRYAARAEAPAAEVVAAEAVRAEAGCTGRAAGVPPVRGRPAGPLARGRSAGPLVHAPHLRADAELAIARADRIRREARELLRRVNPREESDSE
ncbi:STAS domain-containing protein [Cryptosporangium sp. NPDC051539]|uniref:STAS domain-containing protein n=1 Tax=Cryptosporangium sp. NPDC051539 TaxID=3363962 RepID=UPI00379E587E